MATTKPAPTTETTDFLPLKGIDHVEFWVGNAKQAAHYFRALWGFTPVAYSGLETGIRDRASYVLVQNDIRFVFTAPITAGRRGGRARSEARRRGPRHRVRGGRRGLGLARDDLTRRRNRPWSRPKRPATRACSEPPPSIPTAR